MTRLILSNLTPSPTMPLTACNLVYIFTPL
nr:MAG TPA: hypothetical protein [Caudoviricetes sp.]